MAERTGPTKVFLHIGAPKTGTTYLQEVLALNREAMRQQGVLYPQGPAHHAAAWDVRGGIEQSDAGEGISGRWDRLVDEVRAWDGPAVVVSSEMFVLLEEERTRRVVETLDDGPDRELHVVYTARDLVRQLPAVWQEQVKNRRTLRYDAFREDVLGARKTPMARHFWKAQDAAEALARWTAAGVPADRVHVVTAPPPGSPPDVLWGRFAGVVGLDPAAYPSQIPASNESLSVTAVEVLRRYNERHVGGLPIRRYRMQVKRPLMPPLTEGVTDRDRLPLTYAERNTLCDLADGIVAALGKAGYDVVGTLEDLVPPRPARKERKAAGRGPDDLGDAELVDALLDVVHHLLQDRASGGAVPEDGPGGTVSS